MNRINERTKTTNISLSMIMIRFPLSLHLGILLTTLLAAWIPVHYLLAYNILASTLLSHIGHIKGEQGNAIQFTNVERCGKTVSVTAGHYVGMGIMAKVRPDAKLLYLDKELDVAVLDMLGPAFPATMNSKLPETLEEVYIATYVYMIQQPVIIKMSIMGFDTRAMFIQGMLFFGASGSGLYDKVGNYLGPIIFIVGGPSLGPMAEELKLQMPVGIAGAVRTDKLANILDNLLCNDDKPKTP